MYEKCVQVRVGRFLNLDLLTNRYARSRVCTGTVYHIPVHDSEKNTGIYFLSCSRPFTIFQVELFTQGVVFFYITNNSLCKIPFLVWFLVHKNAKYFFLWI